MKMLKIGVWYLSFMIVIVILFWHLPNQWRFCSALAKPTFFESPKQQYIYTNHVVVLGDCQAYLCPWPFPRVAAIGKAIPNDVIPPIPDKAHRARWPVELAVILSGTVAFADHVPQVEIDRQYDNATAQIQAVWPNAAILIVPPSTIHKITNDNATGDGWHLKPTGYDVLLEQYPIIASYISVKSK